MKIYLNYIDKDGYIEKYHVVDVEGHNPITSDIDKGVSAYNITRRIGLMAISQSYDMVKLFNQINYNKVFCICNDKNNKKVKYSVE